MKRCPSCGTTYTDDTLRYCLSDGNILASVTESEIETVFAGRDRLVNSKPKSGGKKLLYFLAGLSVFLFGALVLAGGAFYYFSQNPNNRLTTANSSVEKSAVPIQTPALKKTEAPPVETPASEKKDEPLANITIDDEASIEKKLEEVQKKLEDQLKELANTATEKPAEEFSTTATADSPDDGFLALRSLPNPTAGNRLIKIPHGEKLTIGKCGPVITTKRGNRGRWCRAKYNSNVGFVFDSFVKY